MDVTVNDHRAKSRYEARLENALVGIAEYVLAEDTITFTHTEVEPDHREQGVAQALARFSLDDARERRLTVVPRCSFYRHFLTTHPAYADLLT